MNHFCAECYKPMVQGFTLYDDAAHYCSEACLTKHISMERYLELYDDGDGDCYWTEWEENVCENCGDDCSEGVFIRNEFYCIRKECQPSTGSGVFWRFRLNDNTLIQPKVKWRDTLRGMAFKNLDHHGKRFTVLEDVTDQKDVDPSLPIRWYLIITEDGELTHAMDLEVEDDTWALQEYRVTFDWDRVQIHITLYHENTALLTDKEIHDEALGYAEEAGITLGNEPGVIETLAKGLYAKETS